MEQSVTSFRPPTELHDHHNALVPFCSACFTTSAEIGSIMITSAPRDIKSSIACTWTPHSPVNLHRQPSDPAARDLYTPLSRQYSAAPAMHSVLYSRNRQQCLPPSSAPRIPRRQQNLPPAPSFAPASPVSHLRAGGLLAIRRVAASAANQRNYHHDSNQQSQHSFLHTFLPFFLLAFYLAPVTAVTPCTEYFRPLPGLHFNLHFQLHHICIFFALF